MKWTPVSPDLEVVENKGAPPSAEDQIFSWNSVSATQIQGAFVPYSWYASHKNQVNPLAITGICECGDEVLLGKRGPTVNRYPGFWEFIPSGGVSYEVRGKGFVDYRRQVLLELEEECGFGSPESLTLVGLLQDEESLIDMVVRIGVAQTFTPSCQTGEVTAFQWVRKDALEAFLKARSENVVPATRFLMERCVSEWV